MKKPPSHLPVRSLLLATAMIASFSTASFAQDMAAEDTTIERKWDNLASYIGTYDYDAVLSDKNVRKSLDKALQGNKVDLKKIFEVKAPIGFERDCLVLKGNEQHNGQSSRAYLEACLTFGNVTLAVYDAGKITVYSPLNDYQYLSDGMKQWIYFQNNNAPLQDKPKNVQFVVQAQ